MRIEPADRCVEVGHVLYSPGLQRTPQATEAMYLLARYVFEDLNYRRYEWKCDSLNEPSRVAALRLGFTYEGTFRQHKIVKGLNRDTTWYSMIDSEWPLRKAAFERWLDPANFNADGKQRTRLSALSAAAQAT
jgi:RimJ/RimL family protein N-acetyltransferase